MRLCNVSWDVRRGERLSNSGRLVFDGRGARAYDGEMSMRDGCQDDDHAMLPSSIFPLPCSPNDEFSRAHHTRLDTSHCNTNQPGRPPARSSGAKHLTACTPLFSNAEAPRSGGLNASLSWFMRKALWSVGLGATERSPAQ